MSNLLEYAHANIFASGTMPNGYFGERASCKFTLLPELANFAINDKTMEELDNGIYRLCVVHPDGSVSGTVITRLVTSKAEALWYLQNDSRFKKYYTVN